MRTASLRLVATTLPGHGGTPAPADVGAETYARRAGKLARDLGCDAVVGHSLGANVAIEMARTADFAGTLVLLSPSFSHQDESRFLRSLDRLANVLGPLPFRLVLTMVVVSEAGHMALVEQPARIAEIVLEAVSPGGS